MKELIPKTPPAPLSETKRGLAECHRFLSEGGDQSGFTEAGRHVQKHCESSPGSREGSARLFGDKTRLVVCEEAAVKATRSRSCWLRHDASAIRQKRFTVDGAGGNLS